ncbi:hypothetical protein FOZ61_009309 [Perkinsus olseni]|uniref:Uncharacterized protein n=1 Tax=Perkinsus olseni TaxID=32597 RepID=A0A7J6M5B4_PEROL|nr:hypothetical protein FOZ61_009309 [Perkinsus olseni]
MAKSSTSPQRKSPKPVDRSGAKHSAVGPARPVVRTFSCLTYVMAITVVLMSALFYRVYYQVMSMNVALESIPETVQGSKCREIEPPSEVENIGGMEDVEFVGDGTWAIVSNMDPIMTFKMGPVPKATFPLFALDVNTEALSPLPMNGFPAGVSFRPHGISYHKETSTLGVVNHAWAHGGERVEFFKVIFEGQRPAALQYMKSIVSPMMGHGQLNDLQILEVEPVVKFYATKWWGHPLGDDNGPNVFAKARFVGGLILGLNSCTILYCEGEKCRETGDAVPGYNGIYISHDRSKLAAVVLGDHGLNLFDILPNGDLRTIGHVHVGLPLDNIYPDIERSSAGKQVFYTAGIRRGIDLLYATESLGTANITRGDVAIPTHARRVTIEWGDDNSNSSFSVEELFSTRARHNLGAWSVFARAPKSDKFIIGSFLEAGLLVCD